MRVRVLQGSALAISHRTIRCQQASISLARSVGTIHGGGAVYQSLEAELHDVFWEAEGPAAELPLLRNFLKRHPGKALEIGSGSGRLLLPLLAEGFKLEGLDNSTEMIELCQASAAAKGLEPHLFCCDLFALPAGSRYQAITLPAFTLQLLPDPIAAVARINELLEVGGGIYFSVFYPWAEVFDELPENEFYPDHSLTLPDGKTASITTKHSIDKDAQILTRVHRYEISSSDGVEREHESTQVIRYCEEPDWEHLLDATGFKVTEVFWDFLPDQDEEEETAGVTTFFAVKV
ncbi:class I SAM-dependent methyltransferase [Roseibacillus persicicus]|uniref:class I SAM-dependent methyltransferase n=1 Tax=Roseibacillus persicicus TaxID=454148 RepID=UPI0016795240|nr:class I SAM-dependent methyltransferase [Roseibacillus persicicus]